MAASCEGRTRVVVEPREIATSRGKTLGALAISLGFVAIAVVLPHDGGDETWRWLCGGFFGLGAIVLAAVTIRPQRVTLDREGFTISGGLARRPQRRAWRDVEGFVARRMPRGGTMVFYHLADHARPDTYLGDLTRRWGGDGMLPRTISGTPEAIAAEFNAYRQAALDR